MSFTTTTAALVTRFAGSLALLAAIAGTVFLAPAAVAQDGGSASVTVHARICPEGYEGSDLYQTCHDTAPEPGLPFTLSNGVTEEGTSDGSGNLTFTALAADTYALTGGAPGEFTEERIFCALEQDLGDEIATEPVTGGVQFAVEDGQNVICDWYIIPQGQGGETPTPAPTEPPDGDATVTIYKTACPPGYDGDDYFEDCFDNPQAGVEFFIARGGGGVEGTTGPDGFATIVLPGDALPGLATAQEAVPAGYAVDFFVYCTMDEGDTVLDIEQSSGEPGPDGETTFFASFDVAAGDQIRCDWYNIPPAQETPTPVPTEPPAPTPTPDPDARPAAIREGDCDDDELGDVVVELTGVSQPEGETVGQDDANLAATSFTIIEFSLDEIVAEDHVITIGEPAGDATDDPVVCGEIGGVLDGNGDLVIGLAEQDDSGYTGIAFLSPDADDPDQTEVSVFIAEDLGADDEDIDLDEVEDDAEATEAA